MDVSDIFYFFCPGEWKGESDGAGRGGGTIFHVKSQEGGSPRRVGAGRRGAGRMFEGNFGILGGGLNFFFWGPKFPPRKGTESCHVSGCHRFFQSRFFGPGVMQSGFGVNFYFGPANFRKIAGEFLSEFWWRILIAIFLALFFQGFRPPKKFTPKIHVQNCWHSSPISLSWTQNLFTAIFCLRGRPRFCKKCSQYCWNSMTSFERHSPEPLLKKEASSAVLGGEGILGVLWSLQMLEL